MYSAGTLPLHMYQKDIQVGEAIQFNDLDSEAVASESQESEYDSDSEQGELEHEPVTILFCVTLSQPRACLLHSRR